MKVRTVYEYHFVWIALVLLLFVPLQSGAQTSPGGKFVGNILGGSIPENFSVYWNQVTPENAGKWGAVEGTRNTMNWTILDKYYAYAKSHGFPFKEHTLVWGAAQQGWLSGLSADEQRAEVAEWIRAYCERYPETDLIDVVNEPLHNAPLYREALGGKGVTGWDWVIWAFEQARPYTRAKLLLNDYYILNDAATMNTYLTIVALLKERGLIDGIGIEAHLYESTSIDVLRTNLARLIATGIPVYVTEYDINESDDIRQLNIMQEQFPLFWENPGVAGITLWGYILGAHWRPNAWLVSSGSIGADERPAMQWLRQYLAGTTTPPTFTPEQTPVSTPMPGILGEVNGDGAVNIIDALHIAQFYVGIVPPGFNPANADTNCSGGIDIVDALLVARYYVGLVTGFCLSGIS
jgi:endo-1,4-beta-xylanase